VKRSILLAAFAAINLGVTFSFQLYVLAVLGPGEQTDALFAGMALPQVVLTIVSGSLMHVLVPLLSGESISKLRANAWSFFALVGISFAGLAAILYIMAPWWVPILVPGFSKVGIDLTVELTRIQLIGMVFTAINGVQWAAYHAQNKFIWAEMSSVICSAISLAILLITLPKYGVVGAAWLITVRMALQTILLIPGMGSPSKPNFRSSSTLIAWRRIKPLLYGTAYYKTEPLIDRYILSTATSGGLSLYYLSQQIYAAANQIINKAIAAPFVPQMSAYHKASNFYQLRKEYYQRILFVALISFCSIVLLATVGDKILAALLNHSSFDISRVRELWQIMLWLSGAFIGGGIAQITSTAFYACGDTVTPTRLSIITYTIYIPSKFIGYSVAGIYGLALTTSAYYIINLVVQLIILNIKLAKSEL